MNIKKIIGFGLAVALLTGCECEKCEKKDGEAGLMTEARISKETAQATALAKVPNGTIKEGELEKEHGKLQWSFDVAAPGSTDITEVNVDAITGEVISAAKESAGDEAKEASDEKKKKDDDKD